MQKLAVLACPFLFTFLPAQTDDARLQAGFERWQEAWGTFTKAMTEARTAGLVRKGGELPEAVRELQTKAEAERTALVTEFDARDDLAAGSYRTLARLHETGRDYRAAVRAYERCLAKGDAEHPDLTTMGTLCIAAMNSKDDELAAKWMRTLIAHEDQLGRGPRNLSVRTSYYPRTLIALGDWDGLDALVGKLGADETPACRSAAATFGVVGYMQRGDVTAAGERVAAILAQPDGFPDHQAWAVLVQLALDVHAGEFERGAQQVRTFLAAPARADGSAQDKNQRRYLAAIAPFLGKPAPQLRVDHWVGADDAAASDDALSRLRGKTVVLDFWQPWCEPCRKAMPKLVALQAKHAEDLAVIGPCKIEDYGYDVSERAAVRPIAAADYPAHVVDFHTDMQLNYPLAIAATGANSTAYGVTGIPTLVVIDRQGVVRYMSCGAGEPGLIELAVAGVLAHGAR